MMDFNTAAAEIGALVTEKNAAYGCSFAKCGKFLQLLYPDGIQPPQYDDALAMVRIFDKQMRIATRKGAFGESPYRDIAGYGILGAVKDARQHDPIGAAIYDLEQDSLSDLYLHGTHCDTCARPDCAKGQYPATKDGGCEGYAKQPITVPPPETQQDAPTATEHPAPHTDPAVNCGDCATLPCPHQSHNVTLDQGCDGFKPWGSDFTLPSIALDCTANAAWLKYLEECREVEKAKTVLHSLIELWDCIQAVQTCIEKGGDKRDLYSWLIADMEKRRREGNQVDLARRAMLVKNAARWRYSDKVNRLIIESNGHCFKEADA